MNVPAIKKYANELQGLLSEHDQARAALDHLAASMRAAEKAGDRQSQLQMASHRQRLEAQAGALEQTLLEHTKKGDVEGARTLLTDIAVRLEAADKDFRRLRAMIAEFEFSVAENAFAPEPEEGQPGAGVTRRMYEQSLEEQKARVEKRVQAASDLVPSRVVLL